MGTNEASRIGGTKSELQIRKMAYSHHVTVTELETLVAWGRQLGRGLFRLVKWNVRKETALQRCEEAPGLVLPFEADKGLQPWGSQRELKPELPGHGCHETLSSPWMEEGMAWSVLPWTPFWGQDQDLYVCRLKLQDTRNFAYSF